MRIIEEKNSKSFKRVAYIITFGFLIVLYFYNFWAFDLPYRTKIIQITNSNNDELYLNDLINEYCKTKDTVFDFNESCRNDKIKISGKIIVGKIEAESNNTYKIYSDEVYNQYKRSIFEMVDDAIDGSQHYRSMVIYVSCNKEEIEKIRTGDKIKFTSNFNNMSDKYLILTEGEIIE